MSGITSRLEKLPRVVRRLPTVLRTLRYLRGDQARAQLHHLAFGLAPPTRLDAGDGVTLAIARAATDFLPPPAHVKATAGLEIELLATPFQLGEVPDWQSKEHGPLFAYHLHQHEYLRSPELTPAQRLRCLTDWIDRNSGGVGWDPHPISLRLLCWGKLLLSEGMLDLEVDASASAELKKILVSMADQAATLDAGLETRLQANHLLSNLISVVWAGLLLEGGARADSKSSSGDTDAIGEASAAWRARADELIDELDAQVHPDGGHEERSPMYHSLILENLLDLLNLCRASRPVRVPIGLMSALEQAIPRMLRALSVLTHPDGRIALFADSGFDIAAEPAALHAYAERLGVVGPASSAPASAAILPQTGYVRLATADTVALVSTAGPAPAHQPGHAHCDALSLELSIGGRRVVTDTGLFEYRPGVRRDLARATASHATLQIDGQEQAELWSAHRVGGRPDVELLGWDGEAAMQATCRGWSTPRARHHRAIEVDSAGATIVDRLEGEAAHVRLTWPFDPAWRVEIEAGTSRARATLANEAAAGAQTIVIELSTDLAWRVERGVAFPSFGREVERDVLVGERALSTDPARSWSTRMSALARID